MYGKIFQSMYDGTLADNWEGLVTFQQMIVLADDAGVVDMTIRALSARTGLPQDIIEKGVAFLEAEDPNSRSVEQNGRRIERLDAHRPWGWRLVNYDKYVKLGSHAEKKAADRERIAAKRASECRDVSQGVADVAHIDIDKDIDKKEKRRAKAPFIHIWDIPRAWCGPALLGKILKETGDDKKVKQAVLDTLKKEPAEPKTYFLALLKGKSEDSTTPVWQMSEKELLALAEEKGIPTRGKTTQQLVNDLR